MDTSVDKVWLFKDDHGEYAGYTETKSIKDVLLKQRKKFKAIKVRKDSVDGVMHRSPSGYYECNYLDSNLEFYWAFGDYIMNADEEDRFLSSFEQFKADFAYTYLDRMKSLVDALKLNKEEVAILGKFFELMETYQHAYIHGTLEEEPEAMFEAFNYSTAAELFLEYALEYDIRKPKKKTGTRK